MPILVGLHVCLSIWVFIYLCVITICFVCHIYAVCRNSLSFYICPICLRLTDSILISVNLCKNGVKSTYYCFCHYQNFKVFLPKGRLLLFIPILCNNLSIILMCDIIRQILLYDLILLSGPYNIEWKRSYEIWRNIVKSKLRVFIKFIKAKNVTIMYANLRNLFSIFGDKIFILWWHFIDITFKIWGK